MRNLKKILALVLSLMMVLSVMVTASAADYSDADDIQYTEAVEVMSAMGILAGANGEFNPQGTLYRDQAAKIIAYVVLGPDAANLVEGTGSDLFVDVTGGWAYDYVAFCANEGIINGYTVDGKLYFGPAGTLTGYQFGKMLLNALGIEGKYTGSGWELNVATALKDAGLLDGMAKGFSLKNNLTREEAAQLAFEAMFFTTETDTNTVVYVVTDLTDDNYLKAIDGNSYETYKAAKEDVDTVKSGLTLNTDYKITREDVVIKTKSLAAENYKVAQFSTEDEWGWPVTVYTSTLTALRTMYVVAEKAPAFELEGEVTEADMYSTVGAYASEYYSWDAKVDGVAVSPTVSAPSKNSAAAYAGTGNGTVTKGYYTYDSSNYPTYTKVVLVTVTEKVGTVKKVATDALGRYVILAEEPAAAKYYTNDFAKGDVVLYTYSEKRYYGEDAGIMSMKKAELVSGKLEKVVTVSDTPAAYTVDGKVYVTSLNGTTNLSGAYLNKTVSFYVDSQGNIIRDKSAVAAATNYIFVTGNSAVLENTDYLATAADVVEITGVATDGTVVTYEVTKVGGKTVVPSTVAIPEADETHVAANELKNTLYTYTVDANGYLELTKVEEAADGAAVDNKDTKIDTDIINASTVFVFVKYKGATQVTEKVTVKVGNANLGGGIASTTKVAVGAKNGVANVVYVLADYVDPDADTTDLVFVIKSTETATVTKDGTDTYTVYTYVAFDVDGAPVLVSSKASIATSGVYTLTAGNAVGTSLSAISGAGMITAINGNVVTVGDTTLNLADASEAYLGDDDELLVGQNIVYVKGNTPATANDLVAIWVVEDQKLVPVTFDSSALTGFVVNTGLTTELIAGVENTVVVTLSAVTDNLGVGTWGLTYNVDSGPDQYSTTVTLDKAAASVTLTIVVVPAAASTCSVIFH